MIFYNILKKYKLIKIYLILNLINVFFKFKNMNYLDYLIDTQFNPTILFHFLLPSISYKTKYGFYSILFNIAVYETFIDRDKRKRGYGEKMSKKLVKKYPIVICNSETINHFKKIYKKNNYRYKEFLLSLFRQ